MTKPVPIKPQLAVLDEHKAWLLGLLAGDGGVYRRKDGGNSVNVYAGIDEEVAQHSVELFDRIYGLPARVKKLLPGKARRTRVNFVATLHSKFTVDDLLSLGSFGIETWDVPPAVEQGSRTIQAAWVSGFFEAEGSVVWTRSNGTRHVTLSSINKNVFKVKNALESLGCSVGVSIRTACPEKNMQEAFQLSMTDRDSIEKFAVWINFRSSRKRKVMSDVTGSYAHDPDDSAFDTLVAARNQGRLLSESLSMVGLTEESLLVHMKQREEQGHRDHRGNLMRERLPRMWAMRQAGMKWKEIGAVVGYEGDSHYQAIQAINAVQWAKKKGLWPPSSS